jgi:RimJ/RimL family protein N-acetyltransferase
MQHLPSAMPAVPAIDTERLSLRGHTLDDFEASTALWSDPEVTRYIGGRPQSREEVWTRLLRYIGHWSLLGFGYWVVRERGSARFIGEVGLAEYRREIDPPIEGAPEAGWVMAPAARGKGYATEAVRAALAWGASAFGPAQRTVCIIDPGNLASIRVAEKVGFALAGEASYRHEPSLLFERPGLSPAA